MTQTDERPAATAIAGEPQSGNPAKGNQTMDANTMPPAGRATQDLNDAVFDMDCLVYSVSGHRKLFDFIWSQVGMDRLDPPALYEYERELLLFSWGELSGAVVKLEKAYDKVSEIERAGCDEARS